MAYPISDAFRAALAMPHQVRVQIALLRGGEVIKNDLPFTSGSVTVSAGSWVRRTLSLRMPVTIETGDYETTPTNDFLSTKSDELRVRWGLVFPDGSTEWVPIGVFRIDEIPYDSTYSDAVEITAVDRGADIADYDFLQPRQFTAGSTAALIQQLITEVSPSLTVADLRVRSRDARVPPTQVEGKRSDFIKELGDAIAASVYFDAEGAPTISDAPTVLDDPVFTVRSGEGGTLTRASSNESRDGVFNCVVVRGESPGGDFRPVQATITDNNPTSPTRFGDRLAGFYGKVVRVFDMPTVTTLEQAKAAAQTKLAQYAGILRPILVDSVPLPFLEPGDTILVIPEGKPAGVDARAMIVDSWSMDLQAGGTFNLTARDVREAGLE